MGQEMPKENRGGRVTIHDVARHAQVSAATVSKVLRGVPTVREENAGRVRAVVARLDYRVDPLAAGLRNDQRRLIGTIVPDLENSFFGALVSGFERAAEAAGFNLIVASSRESETREEELVARMNDWRVAGTILVPVRSERGLGTSKLRALDMRAVLVDRASADDRYDTVTADNYKAAAAVADYLVGRGHRHILLHGATRASKALRTRVAGFTERTAVLDPHIRIDTLLSDAETEVQRDAVRAYFRDHTAGERPDAIFSLSQNSTLVVLSELRRQAIRVPEDVTLVGFDDAEWMRITWPSITAVAQPVNDMAERAVATLLARVESDNWRFPVQHMEPCEMLIRQSSGPARRSPHEVRRDG